MVQHRDLYRVMNSAAVQGRHGALGSCRVVIFDKAIIEAFSLFAEVLAQTNPNANSLRRGKMCTARNGVVCTVIPQKGF